MTSWKNKNLLRFFILISFTDRLGDGVYATEFEPLLFDAADVRSLLENGSTRLVDKTEYMLKILMMKDTKTFLLTRPRKFGKSTFLRTFALICEGEKSKHLFKDKNIEEDQSYEWKTYKVVYFDFSKISSTDTFEFERYLESTLKTMVGECKFNASIETQITKLIQTLSEEETNVVVLVDAYDYPIMSALHNHNLPQQRRYNISNANLVVVKRFFSALNEVENKLRLVFVTGVMKFSAGVIFPETDTFYDLSTDPDFAAIVGFTRLDLYSYFDDYIEKIASLQSITKWSFKNELEQLYEGYKFSDKTNEKIYNPYAVLCCLEHGGQLSDYWYQSGSLEHLYTILKQPEVQGGPISVETRVHRKELEGIEAINETSICALMYHEGLYTINQYDVKNGKYVLRIPNYEIQKSFGKELNERNMRLRSHPPVYVCAWNWLDEVSDENVEENVRNFVGLIDSQCQRERGRSGMRRTDYEKMLFCILTEAGLFNIVRRSNTSELEISLKVETYHTVVLIELANNRNISVVVQQLQASEKLRTHYKKKCLCIGINFSLVTDDYYPVQDYYWKFFNRFALEEEFREANVTSRVKTSKRIQKSSFRTNTTSRRANFREKKRFTSKTNVTNYGTKSKKFKKYFSTNKTEMTIPTQFEKT